VDVFAACGSVMYSLFYFPLVIEGFLFKTVGDRSFGLWLDLVIRGLHSGRTF
jgi:hypothetical protein